MDSVLQTLRPADNMRVQFTRDMPTPVALVKPEMARMYPNGLPPVSADYTITLSGMRSRVEVWQRISEPARNGSSPRVLQKTEVSNGTELRTLMTLPDGALKGGRMAPRPNSQGAIDVLHESFVHIITVPARSRYSYRLLPGASANIRVLEITSGDILIARLYVDARKNHSVTQVERFRPSGERDGVVRYEYQQVGDGIWYPSRVEKMGYDLMTNEPFLAETIEVSSAEFNIDVPEETFRLDFPPGTKVLDMILDSSYFVGAPPQPLLEQEFFATPGISPGPQQTPKMKEASGETAANRAAQGGTHPLGSTPDTLGSVWRGRTGLLLAVFLLVGVAVGAMLVLVCHLRRRTGGTPQ